MTIPNSNFGMNNIRDEYGGDRPDAVSEYYRNGVHVKNWAASQNIPTDGTIAWSSFRGQTATSGLDSGAVMRYIWDNKFDLFISKPQFFKIENSECFLDIKSNCWLNKISSI